MNKKRTNKIIHVPLKNEQNSVMFLHVNKELCFVMCLKMKQNHWNKFLPSTGLDQVI